MDDHIKKLLEMADELHTISGMSYGAMGKAIANKGDWITLMRNGSDCHARLYFKAEKWFRHKIKDARKC